MGSVGVGELVLGAVLGRRGLSVWSPAMCCAEVVLGARVFDGSSTRRSGSSTATSDSSAGSSDSRAHKITWSRSSLQIYCVLV